jgi:5-methylcytosine-specific restriction endonuclease McrA
MPVGSTIVLNMDYSFMSINGWYSAIGLILRGRAAPLASYDSKIRSEKWEIPAPAVIQLKEMANTRRRRQPFTLPSHKNVWVREKGRCAYCGVKMSLRATTKEHVHPRGLGGQDTLLNVVAACEPCNGKKGCRTPAQAGMKFREGVELRHLTDEEKLEVIMKTSKSHERNAWLSFLKKEGLSLF